MGIKPRCNNYLKDYVDPVDPTASLEQANKNEIAKKGGLLSSEDLAALARYGLPQHLREAKWSVLYSLPRDGASFHAFIDKVKRDHKTILAIKTERGIVIGGYAEEPWHVSSSFFGTGNSFLFSIRNVMDPLQQDESDCWGTPKAVVSIEESGYCGPCGSSDSQEEMSAYEMIVSGILGCAMDRTDSSKLLSMHCCLGSDWYGTTGQKNSPNTTMDTTAPKPVKEVRIYDWTGNNRYFQFCNGSAQRVAFGGGGPKSNFGLCIDKEFISGSSGTCDTFRNAPLAVDPVFQIMDMEVYGISSY